MSDLGGRLRTARESAGLSLEQVAERTKIKRSTLQAIERGNFTRLPGGLFTRGFLRAYAHEVGLDAESVVRDYLAEVEPPPSVVDQTVPAPADENLVRSAVVESPPRRKRLRLALWPLAIIIAAIAAAIVLAVVRSHRATSERGAVATTGRAEPGAGPVVGRLENGPAEQAATPPPAAGTLRLELHAVRLVWIAATADGKSVIYRLLQPGERARVDARDAIKLRVGDADAVEYWINGVPGQPLGAASEVRDVEITPQNYRTFEQRR